MEFIEKKIDPPMEIKSEDCEKVLSSIKKVLIEKNKRYGNAALSPLGVFYKGDATSSICIRLDDKLSRIKNAKVLRKNDLFDLLGYCILFTINYMDTNDMGMYNTLGIALPSFEERVDECVANIFDMYNNNIFELTKYVGVETFSYDGFRKTTKDNLVIDCLNGACSDIKDCDNIPYNRVLALITYLVIYFIESKVTDFSDLID